MPTSLQDPLRAQQQRDSLRSAEEPNEREWWLLLLAGPVLGLMGVVGLIVIVYMICVIVERVTR